MATTTVADYVIWAKHVHGDRGLAEKILSMRAGETVELEVDGRAGLWRKMDDGADGRPTQGVRPVGAARLVWRDLFTARRGETVELRVTPTAGDDAQREEAKRRARLVAPPLGRTEAERKAAFRAVLDLKRHGYRSRGPYGPRDELHERE